MELQDQAAIRQLIIYGRLGDALSNYEEQVGSIPNIEKLKVEEG